jgi:hypothetical protein
MPPSARAIGWAPKHRKGRERRDHPSVSVQRRRHFPEPAPQAALAAAPRHYSNISSGCDAR